MLTMEQATRLAMEIDADTRFAVIAIGRFVLSEELGAGRSIDDLPWGVSLMARDNPKSRATIWSSADWDEYRLIQIENSLIASGAKHPKPITKPVHEEQLSLF